VAHIFPAGQGKPAPKPQPVQPKKAEPLSTSGAETEEEISNRAKFRNTPIDQKVMMMLFSEYTQRKHRRVASQTLTNLEYASNRSMNALRT
jgi:hypothetical protein